MRTNADFQFGVEVHIGWAFVLDRITVDAPVVLLAFHMRHKVFALAVDVGVVG